jgi:hypothetical protein
LAKSLPLSPLYGRLPLAHLGTSEAFSFPDPDLGFLYSRSSLSESPLALTLNPHNFCAFFSVLLEKTVNQFLFFMLLSS